LRFGALWYAGANAVNNAISYAKFRSRSHQAVIRVYDKAGNVIATHEHAGDFKECRGALVAVRKRFRFLNAERFGTILP
jgi:hypothetical protein